jgi:fumarate reductase subunit C
MSRRPYRQAQQPDWWRHNPAYRQYMLREATAVPLFLYTLMLLAGVFQFARGETAFAGWLAFLGSPTGLLLHALALAAALWHAWTWIELVPKILVLHTARGQVAPALVKRAHQLLALGGLLGVPLLTALLLARSTGD